MTQNAPAVMEQVATPVTIGFNDSASFELTQRAAKLFASSSLVPKDFQGNIANCAIAVNMAHRIGADELMVMQNLYIVHGRPGWSSQFLIATFNNNPKFSALRYEFKGAEGDDNWSCRAWAVEVETGEKLYGSWVSIGLAKKEGWYGKNGSKWQSMPQQMLMYRAASWFIRAYAPEIAMGLHTAEELRETIDVVAGDDGTYQMEPQAPAVNLDELWDELLEKTQMAGSDDEAAFREFVKLTAESNGCTLEDLLPSAIGQSSAFLSSFNNWKAKNGGKKEESASEPEQEQEAAGKEQEPKAEDAEEIMGEKYMKLNAAEQKKHLMEQLKGLGISLNKQEGYLGKTYGQWTKKDRIALIDAIKRLGQGEDPVIVFQKAN